jgi:GNAT superfamily N-acetyltransferase
LFLAYKDGKTVGRIAGIRSHAANDKYKTKNLRFGWFDTINDYEVARSLLLAVEKWGKELGMETMTGPHGFSDLDPEGMLVEGFDQLPTISVYYNFPYYPEFVEKYGFEKEIDYLEFRSVNPEETGIPPKLLRLGERIKQRSGVRVHKFKNKREVKKRSVELFYLLDEAFEEIYGSVPLSENQIKYYVKKYFSFVDKDLIQLAVDENDEAIGFMIAMPSLSKGFQKAKGRLLPFGWFHILKSLKNYEVLDFYLAGIKKSYRGQGIDLLMVLEVLQTALKKGVKYAESNPELETNKKIHAQWKYFNPTQHKRRRIYKKDVAPPTG